MLSARLEVEAALARDRIGVRRIVDRPLDGDLDAADRVDHLAKALDVDGREVVDPRPEQLADRPLERGRPTLRVRGRVGACRRHQRVQLRVVDPPIVERDSIQVARHGDQRALAGQRIERGHEHRVGQVLVSARREVDSHEEDGHALAQAEVRLKRGCRHVDVAPLPAHRSHRLPRARRCRAYRSPSMRSRPARVHRDRQHHQPCRQPGRPAMEGQARALPMSLQNRHQPPAEQRDVQHDERDRTRASSRRLATPEPLEATTSTPRMPMSSTGIARSEASAHWPL